MILKALFRKFRVSEFIQFFTQIINLCTRNSEAAAQVKESLNTFSASAYTLENTFKHSQASAITARLSKLDAERDQCIICLRKLADAYDDHFKPKLREAGEKLLKAIDKYGPRIYAMNYQAETSTLTNLGEDLTTNPELVAAVQTLGEADLVNEMLRLNSEFDELYINRVEEDTADDSISSGEALKTAIADYRDLLNHIEAYAVISSSEANSKLIAEMNTLIELYNTLVEQRSKHNGTDEDDESTLDDDAA